MLVVGGSVLKSLKLETTAKSKKTDSAALQRNDIDIYVYGLTPDQAQVKVEEVFNSIQSCWHEKIGIFKTARTITLVSNREFRNVQIILRYAICILLILFNSKNY